MNAPFFDGLNGPFCGNKIAEIVFSCDDLAVAPEALNDLQQPNGGVLGPNRSDRQSSMGQQAVFSRLVGAGGEIAGLLKVFRGDLAGGPFLASGSDEANAFCCPFFRIKPA